MAEPSHKSDTVVLRAPRGQSSLPLLRVVLGGMASRHALSVDRLDDLQLAVETLFREEPFVGEDFTLTLVREKETLKVTLAGLCSALVLRTLSGAPATETEKLGAPGILRMIMEHLVDGYRTVQGSSAASFAVEMDKRIR